MYLECSCLKLSQTAPRFSWEPAILQSTEVCFFNSWKRQSCDSAENWGCLVRTSHGALCSLHRARFLTHPAHAAGDPPSLRRDPALRAGVTGLGLPSFQGVRARAPLKNSFWTVFIAPPFPVWRRNKRTGEKLQFGGGGQIPEDRVTEGPPQPDTTQSPPTQAAEAARRRRPRPAPRAGHWRVRKSRGGVGLNGSAWSWGAGAEEGSGRERAARRTPGRQWDAPGGEESRELWPTWSAGGRVRGRAPASRGAPAWRGVRGALSRRLEGPPPPARRPRRPLLQLRRVLRAPRTRRPAGGECRGAFEGARGGGWQGGGVCVRVRGELCVRGLGTTAFVRGGRSRGGRRGPARRGRGWETRNSVRSGSVPDERSVAFWLEVLKWHRSLRTLFPNIFLIKSMSGYSDFSRILNGRNNPEKSESPWNWIPGRLHSLAVVRLPSKPGSFCQTPAFTTFKFRTFWAPTCRFTVEIGSCRKKFS